MFWKKSKNKNKDKPKVLWHLPEGYPIDLTPRKATEGAMAWDLVSPINYDVPPISDPNIGKPVIVKTMIAVTLPEGYALLLGSRSGNAAKHSITVEAGWIDNDYRGIIGVVLYNHGSKTHSIKAGDRIAQAQIVKVHDVDDRVVNFYPDPEETKRGSGGFGSTGS